jgi:hypothetical protein
MRRGAGVAEVVGEGVIGERKNLSFGPLSGQLGWDRHETKESWEFQAGLNEIKI